MAKNGYTPTEAKIVEVLSDGMPHSREELHRCLWDEQSNLETIKTHIYNIRKHLKEKGEDIVCRILNRQILYQHVRLLQNEE